MRVLENAQEGVDLKKDHICGVCGGILEVAWWGKYGLNKNVLICGACPQHEGLERVPSVTSYWKQGGRTPVHVQNVLEKKYERSINQMTTEVQLSNEVKTQVKSYLVNSFSGTLAVSELEKAYHLKGLGFDHAFHMCIYQGKLTLTIDGWYWWARGDAQFGRLISRPTVTKEERDAYGVGENEIGCIAELYFVGSSVPNMTGFGRASKDEKSPVIRGSAVEKQHPFRMAEKRAEAQVLRKFRPVGVPIQIPEEMTTNGGGDAPTAAATTAENPPSEAKSADLEVGQSKANKPATGKKSDQQKAKFITDKLIAEIKELTNWDEYDLLEKCIERFDPNASAGLSDVRKLSEEKGELWLAELKAAHAALEEKE